MNVLTYHAAQRIIERAIADDSIAAALCGRCLVDYGDTELWYDRGSRTVVVIDPTRQRMVTVYRILRKNLKARFSR